MRVSPDISALDRILRLSAFDGDSAVLKAGQWFAIVTPGAGGFGPPVRRDPMAAACDLAEGAISPATAQGVYGL